MYVTQVRNTTSHSSVKVHHPENELDAILQTYPTLFMQLIPFSGDKQICYSSNTLFDNKVEPYPLHLFEDHLANGTRAFSFDDLKKNQEENKHIFVPSCWDLSKILEEMVDKNDFWPFPLEVCENFWNLDRKKNSRK